MLKILQDWFDYCDRVSPRHDICMGLFFAPIVIPICIIGGSIIGLMK